jgi:hypothetical protein
MSTHEWFHSVLFIVVGIVLLCNVRGENKPRKYINLCIGVLDLLIAFYDILVTGFGI